MVSVLNQGIEQISREKGIEPGVIHEALEDAMVAAAKKFFKSEEDLQARYDTETGTIDVFAVKKIVEEVSDENTEMPLAEALEIDESFEIDDYIEIPKPTVELGRIAAQTAKQVITQKVREAEREIIFAEFSEQIGQLVNAIVRRVEGREIILDIGRTEAILPFSEQCRNELYNLGERIRAVIIKVHRLTKGPQIVVSRSDPSLLIRLFEMEIPEVYDATVVCPGFHLLKLLHFFRVLRINLLKLFFFFLHSGFSILFRLFNFFFSFLTFPFNFLFCNLFLFLYLFFFLS